MVRTWQKKNKNIALHPFNFTDPTYMQLYLVVCSRAHNENIVAAGVIVLWKQKGRRRRRRWEEYRKKNSDLTPAFGFSEHAGLLEHFSYTKNHVSAITKIIKDIHHQDERAKLVLEPFRSSRPFARAIFSHTSERQTFDRERPPRTKIDSGYLSKKKRNPSLQKKGYRIGVWNIDNLQILPGRNVNLPAKREQVRLLFPLVDRAGVWITASSSRSEEGDGESTNALPPPYRPALLKRFVVYRGWRRRRRRRFIARVGAGVCDIHWYTLYK